MEGSVVEDPGAPESWEVADLDVNLSRLMLRDSNSTKKDSSESLSADSLNSVSVSGSFSSTSAGTEKVSQDAINQVDQFLREALQNPRERLSVLRIEQAVANFIRDPNQQQLEFSQLPTSYLRLAAHRVAQHYSLHSMVLSDNNLSDSCGSRIIVCKTSECRLPMIRLADIPVNLPSEDGGAIKVAIKQRPQKQSQTFGNSNSNSSEKNNSRSVEERKEEYNRARARIFNSSNSSSGSEKLEIEPKFPGTSQHGSSGISRLEEKSSSGFPDVNSGRPRCLIESSTSSSRSNRGRSEKEPVGRYKPNNKVAIFRDREVERKDPDFDRSYDRYMQRFDPGFGFSGGSYTMQPMYTPAVTYNTEFPQLGSTNRPHLSVEHHSRLLPQHLPGPWTAPSSPAGIGYGPDTIMTSFNPNHVGSRPSAMYLHSSQYPGQHPGLTYIHHEHVHPPFSQSHQQQPDASYGLARPR